MFESGGKSVRCQNLYEPLLSPCMFEPLGQISPLPKSARTTFDPATHHSISSLYVTRTNYLREGATVNSIFPGFTVENAGTLSCTNTPAAMTDPLPMIVAPPNIVALA